MFRTLKKKFNIDCVYKKTATSGNYFFKRRPEQDIWDTTHVCYQVPCGKCPMKYICHTKRKLHTRVLKERNKSCEGDLTNIQPNHTNDNLEFPSTVLQLDIPLNLKTQKYWKEKGINSDVRFWKECIFTATGTVWSTSSQVWQLITAGCHLWRNSGFQGKANKFPEFFMHDIVFKILHKFTIGFFLFLK